MIKMINNLMNFKMVKSMKKWKNYVKLLLCVCAMGGLAACSSDSSRNTPTPNTDTPIITIDQSDLTIGDNDIDYSGDNHTFTLIFTADILAESISENDFITTDSGNITILNITPSTGIVKEVTVEFKFTDANNTAKDEITIAAGSIIGSENQINDEAIVIY